MTVSKTTPVPLLALLALSACHIGLGEDTEWGTQGATSTSTTGTSTTTDTGTTSTTSGSSNGTTTSTTSTTSNTATTDDSTTADTTSGPDPVCGNGMKEGGEECDDGNMVNDDMCTNMCSTPKCGDMLVQTGEECDDGNKINEDACLDTCKKASCGDGFIQTDAEECDKTDNMNYPPGCLDGSCMWDKRIVFVTSQTFTPGADSATAFNSIATADAKCQAAAKDKFPGTFRAWLSGGANSPAKDWTDLNNFAGKFVLPNGTIVATGWNNGDLSIDGPINIDENKEPVVNASVWTGTNETGMATTSNCNVWLQGNGNGTTGLTIKSDAGWTNASEQPCGDSRRLYCFQTALP